MWVTAQRYENSQGLLSLNESMDQLTMLLVLQRISLHVVFAMLHLLFVNYISHNMYDCYLFIFFSYCLGEAGGGEFNEVVVDEG